MSFVTNYIIEKKINTTIKVEAALNYLLKNVNKIDNIADFEESCGVGVTISSEEIKEEVEKVIKVHKNEILKKR